MVKKILSSTVDVVIYVVGLLAGIIELLNYIRGETYKNDKNFIWGFVQNTNIVEIFVFFVVTIIVITFVKRKLKKKGVRNVPISFFKYIKKFNPLLCYESIRALHEFEHVFNTVVGEINKENITLISNEGKKKTTSLIKEMYVALRVITGVDFSINVKLFEKNGVSPNSFLAKTYERFPSKIEREKRREKDSEMNRNTKEEFLVNIWEEEELSDLYRHVSKQIDNHKKKNLSYDYVVSGSRHYWLSNNLNVDIKNKLFISNSNRYRQFYNSLGVFLIAPHHEEWKAIENDSVKGLLIVDSLTTGVFQEKNSKSLIGYFAHRFYDYICAYKEMVEK